MLKRRAQMMDAFFKILLAIIIFVPTILWAAKLYGATQHASNSFDDLVNYINKDVKDTSLVQDSVPLDMDDGSLILFFNHDISYISSILPDSGNTDVYFKKPDDCGSGSCICLCSDYSLGKEQMGYPDLADFPAIPSTSSGQGINPVGYYMPTCDKYTCEKSDASFISSSDIDRKATLSTLPTGFIFAKVKGQATERTAYIAKYDGYMAVCLDQPCMDLYSRYFLDRSVVLSRIKGAYDSCAKFKGSACACATMRKVDISPVLIPYSVSIGPLPGGSMNASLSDYGQAIASLQMPYQLCAYNLASKTVARISSQIDLQSDKDIVIADDDIDDDGIPNEQDPDIDGDGIPNAQDPDKDGDGIKDPTYATPTGFEGRPDSATAYQGYDTFVLYKVNSTYTCFAELPTQTYYSTTEYRILWKDGKRVIETSENGNVNSADDVPFCAPQP